MKIREVLAFDLLLRYPILERLVKIEEFFLWSNLVI